MQSVKRYRIRASKYYLLSLLGVCVLIAGPLHAQTVQPPSGETSRPVDKMTVPDAIAKIKSGKFDGVHVERIIRANAVEAMPALKEQFAQNQDQLTKAKIAEALVKLGERDDSYWSFLVKLASEAIESDAPNYSGFDAQGRSMQGPSPEFVKWAKIHSAPENIGEEVVYILPGKVMLLGATGDRRAIPLLQKALISPNYFIEAAGALGLAEIQDRDSISLIIDACKRAPEEAAREIALSLVYFDDEEAQAAVDRYVPKDTARVFREARANGRGPLH